MQNNVENRSIDSSSIFENGLFWYSDEMGLLCCTLYQFKLSFDGFYYHHDDIYYMTRLNIGVIKVICIPKVPHVGW